MREVEFRGRFADEDDNYCWVYGYYVYQGRRNGVFNQTILEYDYDRHLIVTKTMDSYNVHPETLGQYTRLKDKNGTKIFKGDIVKFNNQVGHIVYECGSFGIVIKEGIDYERLEDFTRENLDNNFNGTFNDNFLPLFEIYYNLNNVDGYIEEVQVIGNIYDNPDLLGE